MFIRRHGIGDQYAIEALAELIFRLKTKILKQMLMIERGRLQRGHRGLQAPLQLPIKLERLVFLG
jgi:hypothetical protein